MSEIKVTKTLPEHSRKRVVQSNKHKRTISKQNRYSAKSLPKYPTCSHKEGTIKCRTLSMMDIKRFHELFYNNKDKVAQDTLIYKCCYALKPKRSRLAINARGHSFMPPDRVFGLIEREIKKNTCICEPREYHRIIEQHSTLRVLGKDWHAYDWKAATQDIIKLPGNWHFQFNPSKRFLLTRGNQDLALIQGEAHYRTNVEWLEVFEKGKRILSIAPNKLVPGRTVNNEKKKSIDNLLIKHFGPDWKSLQNLKFYKDAMENQNVQDSPSSSTMTEEFTCDQNPEDDTRFV
ncbi:hypothetical protein JTB14_017213 [Gonioctena quinquepunctata]|nr:hypothetical protein JTB14_017213 [Gonioctena quinquepunctata]